MTMIGRLTGKATTKECAISLNNDIKNFEYVKIPHSTYEWVLGQVVEVEVSESSKKAICNIIGYYDKGFSRVRIPPEPGSEVFIADDEFIRKMISLSSEGLYIGKVEGRDIKVMLDLQKLLTKHVSILAKSGAGKSYTVGVLIEEILDHNVPVVIIDPHGEYSTLRSPAKPSEETAVFGIKPKSYPMTAYGNDEFSDLNPLALNNKLSRDDLIRMLPKLNPTQQAILYSAIRRIDSTDFDSLLLSLESEESMGKWSLINLIESLKNYKIFSEKPTPAERIVRPGHATVINLKGYPPHIQEIIVYKLVNDLYNLRKKGGVPPFFLVVEEAHNFCPERSFGEASSSHLLRTIASEGRKFGLGLCVVSQRPARVDKSVLSQCTTQIILKVTNPHDLRSIGSSVEGLTLETEKEIRNLPVGTALITGIVDIPLIVDIRPRRTAHGGEAVSMRGEVRPLIFPNISLEDFTISLPPGTKALTVLRPALKIIASTKGSNEHIPLLFDLARGALVVDIDNYKTKKLPDLSNLNLESRKALKKIIRKKEVLISEFNDKTIAELRSKGFIVVNQGIIKPSKAFIFHKPKKIYFETVFGSVNEDSRIKRRYSPAEALSLISRYFKVKESKECWIVTYVKKES